MESVGGDPELVVVCSECAYVPDPNEYEPYCSMCGHSFILQSTEDRTREVIDPYVPSMVEHLRVNCICYGVRLRHDLVAGVVTHVFRCGWDSERINCVGCPACPKCGKVICACGFLGTLISVKLPPTIETVARKA